MIRLSPKIVLISLIVLFFLSGICSAMTLDQIMTTCMGGGSGNGTAATIGVNWTFTGLPGTDANVTNVGTSSAALLDFFIPAGAAGAAGADGPMNQTPNMTPGSAATIAVNYTFTLVAGSPATVTNIGSASAASLDFGIPTGATGAAGSNGADGVNGTSASVTVNYTFTGAAGTDANVTNVGNTTVALLDFTIPQGLTGSTGATGATGGTGGQILYFRNGASTDPITYEGLIPVPAGATEVDENVTVKSNQVLIDSYINDIGYPAVTELPAGLWRFRTFHYVDSASGNSNAVFKVYNRTAGGTETLLFTATSEDINALTTTEYLTSYVQTSPYPVTLTDRIVVKVYGQTDHAANIVFHWVYEGSTHTSHIQTTLESAPATSLSFNVIAGETLYKGQAVYISGASGGNPVVNLADNTGTAKSRVVGLVVADTANAARGVVRRSGVLTSVDTQDTNANLNPLAQTWSAGDLLFATTGGGLTNVRPTSGRSVKAAYSLTGSSATDVLLAYPMENPVWITAASAENIVLRMGDSAGANKTSFRTYGNTEVAYIDSLGNASFRYIVNLTSGSSGDSVVNKSYVDSVASSYNASYVTTSNTSYVLTSNTSYVLTNNASYVLTNNETYVLTTNTSYVLTNNASYVRNPQYGYITLMAGSAMVTTTNPVSMNQNETNTNKNNFIYMNFTDQGSENAQWIVDFPADWNATANVVFTPIWTAPAGTGTVHWDIAGKLFPDDAALDTALAAIGDSEDTITTAGDLQVGPDTAGAAITSVGTGGNTAIIKVTRDSNTDNLAGTSSLIGLRIKYIRSVAAV